jgi:hypothetical protein
VREELTKELTKGKRMGHKKRVALEVEVEREVARRLANAAGISRKRLDVSTGSCSTCVIVTARWYTTCPLSQLHWQATSTMLTQGPKGALLGQCGLEAALLHKGTRCGGHI